MKTARLLFLCFMFFVLLCSCENKDENPVEPGMEIWGGEGPDGILTTVSISAPSTFYSDSINVYVETIDNPVTSNLDLNNTQINLEWIHQCYELWTAIDFEPLIFSWGDDFSYEYEQNGNIASGSLATPYLPDVNWSEFNFHQDYAFDWSLPISSLEQVVGFIIIRHNYHTIKYWLIDGSERSFTIDKNLYENFFSSETNVYIFLTTVNYEIDESIMVMSTATSNFEFGQEFKPDIDMIKDLILEKIR
jgi:hypothetical protein